ncbi:hypothetical protein LRP30_40515 [Bradyrhizobium sp. C-145]|uniref:hypothetical protein n=1 Tax=Bradyrhizobium sp. C-145 TaxID=574727 RepID=UPI00201B73CB|nr:hypothetical protein [Bradyrhizobium sp. C-145]UQR62954.1 hypothetical protein LRP30_40515 [Bradyrhizobium sp. C-145]
MVSTIAVQTASVSDAMAAYTIGFAKLEVHRRSDRRWLRVSVGMGIAPEVGMGAIRFSLGRGTTPGEIDEVVGVFEGSSSPSRG